MKYFVLGAFSSAIFVYGIALTYGADRLDQPRPDRLLPRRRTCSPRTAFCSPASPCCSSASASRSPPCRSTCGRPTSTRVHRRRRRVSWRPSPRSEASRRLLRVFFSSFGTLAVDWKPILFVVAILTLVTGAVLGLVQRDIKRMLAYSSINHAGFVLLGLQAGLHLGHRRQPVLRLRLRLPRARQLHGHRLRRAAAATGATRSRVTGASAGASPPWRCVFAILLLAQAGAPFTTGFLAKLYVVEAAVQAHSYALAVIAMLSGAIAAAFYLRVVFVMYGTAPERLAPATAGGGATPRRPDRSCAGTGPSSPAPRSWGHGRRRAPSPVGWARLPKWTRWRTPASWAIVESRRTAQIGLFLTVAFTVVLGIWPVATVRLRPRRPVAVLTCRRAERPAERRRAAQPASEAIVRGRRRLARPEAAGSPACQALHSARGSGR